jgi:glycosyltransferase involved in cell wall biosynthesis
MSNSESKPKVTVIFPTKNESATIAQSIAIAKQGKYKPSVIVVDGHSTDGTCEIATKNGAEVVVEERRIYPGKGAAMKLGIIKALSDKADIITFMDADIQNLTSDWIDKLVDLIVAGRCDMSRGMYLREPRDASVTKLVAKPLIWVFFPEISHFEQPLSGEIAAKAEVWRTIIEGNPPDGWGVDVWILIEAAIHGYRISETFLGTKTHRSFTTYADNVAKLSKMGEQVALAIIQEAIKHGRIDNVAETNP